MLSVKCIIFFNVVCTIKNLSIYLSKFPQITQIPYSFGINKLACDYRTPAIINTYTGGSDIHDSFVLRGGGLLHALALRPAGAKPYGAPRIRGTGGADSHKQL
jgi:hypothetical protein